MLREQIAAALPFIKYFEHRIETKHLGIIALCHRYLNQTK